MKITPLLAVFSLVCVMLAGTGGAHGADVSVSSTGHAVEEDESHADAAKPLGCVDSCTNPRICLLNGVSHRYRNAHSTYRGGKWYKSRTSNQFWKGCAWVNAADVRHPSDPRLHRVAGRWRRYSKSHPGISSLVRYGGKWFKDSKLRSYWAGGRWHRVQLSRNRFNPYVSRTASGIWARRTDGKKFRVWEGYWTNSAGLLFVNRKWVKRQRVIRNDPHFRYNKSTKTWVNRSWRSKDKWAKGRQYVFKWGVWFRKAKSNLCFVNRKWVPYAKLHRNNPNWKKLANGRWAKVGVKTPYVKKNGFWYKYATSTELFYKGQWRHAEKFLNQWRARAARSQLLRGQLTNDMTEAVESQVELQFAKFMKWFTSTYLRGGQNVVDQNLVSVDDINLRNKKWDIEPNPSPAEKEAPGVNVGAPPVTNWLVDGKTAPSTKSPLAMAHAADGSKMANLAVSSTEAKAGEAGEAMVDEDMDDMPMQDPSLPAP